MTILLKSLSMFKTLRGRQTRHLKGEEVQVVYRKKVCGKFFLNLFSSFLRVIKHLSFDLESFEKARSIKLFESTLK